MNSRIRIFSDLAVTHRSFASVNNERLEFLGDSILGFVITEALFLSDKSAPEGVLTRLRARLVRGATLATMAREISLDSVMRLGSGEKRSGGHQRDSILADGLESVLGAVLLDGGYAEARRVILGLYSSRLEDLPSKDALKDPKSRLQEALQAEGLALPEYQLKDEAGPAHDRRFEVLCRIEACDITTAGAGSSLRSAEQEAAAKALVLIQND